MKYKFNCDMQKLGQCSCKDRCTEYFKNKESIFLHKNQNNEN